MWKPNVWRAHGGLGVPWQEGKKPLTQLKGLKTSPWRGRRDEHAKKPNKPISGKKILLVH